MKFKIVVHEKYIELLRNGESLDIAKLSYIDEDGDEVHCGYEENYFEFGEDGHGGEDIIAELRTLCVDTFPQGVRTKEEYLYLFNESRDYSVIDILKRIDEEHVEIRLYFSLDLTTWAHPFTPIVFMEKFIDEFSVNKFTAMDTTIYEHNSYIDIEAFSLSNDGEIEYLRNELINHVENTLEKVIITLNKNIKEDLLVKVFRFPESYKFVCTQYLVWFGELLSEIGIKADIYSEQNGNETKIIVAPENAKNVLNKVEQLFYKYISLPYVEYLPVTANSTYDKTIVLNLQAQIGFFQTQIQMKEAILELKNTTIQSLNSKIVEQNLLLDSLNDKNQVEFFGGILSLGNIEWGPIKLSPKKLLEKIG
ncbi:hypothetical protein C0W54_21605 [Photobacterium kishitanii]|uniref:hypothetical protein n=1 Tax=Photobacterium kishitanii TaxID=318456 RepID=UPI000D154BD8|nr:hypothetical protein [Photobacterium kishitanii]PSW57936.1 hypothetical protein C0W54_21605 [Photobacterium kishitanii]